MKLIRECETNLKNADRIGYLDIAKCIGMIFVIHNHLGLDYNNGFIKIVIASFHMPLFFIVSGLVKCNREYGNITQYVFKKCSNILLPYYLWSFIFSDFNLKNLIYIIYGSNRSISAAGGVGGSWFLPCFFLADLIYYLVKRVTKGHMKFDIIALLVLLLCGWRLSIFETSIGFFMSIDVALTGAGFIFIGDVVKKIELQTKITKLKRHTRFLIMVLLMAVTSVLAFLNASSYDNEYMRPVMALGYYGNYVLFIMTGVAGTMMVIIASMFLDKSFISDYLRKVGRNTFSILLTQQICIIYIEKIIGKMSFMVNPIGAIILSVVLIVFIDYFARFITYVIPNLRGKYLFEK